MNTNKNAAHCFSCNFSVPAGHAQEVLARYGIIISVNSFLVDEVRPAVRLPDHFSTDFSMGDGIWALKYLTQRKVSRADIALYGIGYTPGTGCVGYQGGRVIIPVLDDDGTLVNWQGRDYTGCAPANLQKLSATGGKTLLFNLTRPASTGVVVLVEGPYDALRLPAWCCALMGKQLTAAQRAQLLRADPKIVLICLDRDAPEANISAIQHGLAGLVPIVTPYRLAAPIKDLNEAPDDVVSSLDTLCQTLAATPGLAPGVQP